MKTLEKILIQPYTTCREAIKAIGNGAVGIVLVVNQHQHLLGTVTDGDIRQTMLTGLDMDTPISELLAQKVKSEYSRSITALVIIDRPTLLQLM